MEVIVKQSKPKVDPKHPQSTDPTWKYAAEKGAKRYGKMEFENDAARRDYLRAVDSNPGNVVGMPAFFPPLKIRSVMPMLDREYTVEERKKMWEYRKRQIQTRQINLLCESCRGVMPHIVAPDGSYCQQCGNAKKWHQ